MARWKLTEGKGGLSDFEFGWLVGLIEGEGTFFFSGSKSQKFAIDMTDEDTIFKVAALLERIIGSHVRIRCRDNTLKLNHKDSFYIQFYGGTARKLMLLLVKHMGWRRRQQIWLALNKCTSSRAKTNRNLPVIDITKYLRKDAANG